MVEADFAEHWDRLLFGDYLIAHAVANAYEALKRHLASTYPNDRVAYTRGKTEFVAKIMDHVKRRDGEIRTLLR